MVGHHPFIVNSTHRWQGRKTLYIRMFLLFVFLPLLYISNEYTIMFLTKVNNIAVTDYVSGGELFSLVEKYNCLPEKVVRIYVAEIALAIGKINFYNSSLRSCKI